MEINTIILINVRLDLVIFLLDIRNNRIPYGWMISKKRKDVVRESYVFRKILLFQIIEKREKNLLDNLFIEGDVYSFCFPFEKTDKCFEIYFTTLEKNIFYRKTG